MSHLGSPRTTLQICGDYNSARKVPPLQDNFQTDLSLMTMTDKLSRNLFTSCVVLTSYHSTHAYLIVRVEYSLIHRHRYTCVEEFLNPWIALSFYVLLQNLQDSIASHGTVGRLVLLLVCVCPLPADTFYPV